MVVVLAALAMAQGQPAPDPAPDSEILVLTERLRSIKISPGVTIRKGVATLTSACKIKRSSGDSELDALACNAVTTCAATPQTDRKAFNACVEETALDAIFDLKAQRAEMRAAQIETEEGVQ